MLCKQMKGNDFSLVKKKIYSNAWFAFVPYFKFFFVNLSSSPCVSLPATNADHIEIKNWHHFHFTSPVWLLLYLGLLLSRTYVQRVGRSQKMMPGQMGYIQKSKKKEEKQGVKKDKGNREDGLELFLLTVMEMNQSYWLVLRPYVFKS